MLLAAKRIAFKAINYFFCHIKFSGSLAYCSHISHFLIHLSCIHGTFYNSIDFFFRICGLFAIGSLALLMVSTLLATLGHCVRGHKMLLASGLYALGGKMILMTDHPWLIYMPKTWWSFTKDPGWINYLVPAPPSPSTNSSQSYLLLWKLLATWKLCRRSCAKWYWCALSFISYHRPWIEKKRGSGG